MKATLWTPIAALLAALLAAAPAAAAEEPPRFLLERIEVEGLEREAARQIVLAESRLRAGGSYAEAELREAVYRVKRLPFVVDADMALRRGSERGAYALVIAVEAAKPVAFAIDVSGVGSDPDDFGGDDRFDFGAAATVSARKFLGKSGLLFGSVQGFDVAGSSQVVQMGYTRYGVWRPGGFATVGVSSSVGGDYASDNLQTSVQTGMPIAGNHALRAGLAWTRIEDELFFFEVGRFEQRYDALRGQLEWIFDTTDDPLVPSAGVRVSTSAAYEEDRRRTRQRAGAEPPFALSYDSTHWLLRAEARHYWPLTPRQSVALGGGASHSEQRAGGGAFENREDVLALEAIHAVSLRDVATSLRLGDLRLENAVGVERFHESSAFDRDQDETGLFARSSLLFRNAWGLVRLSLLYTDVLGRER